MPIRRILIIAAWSLAMVSTISCARAVKVVVPNGFAGEARVVFDPVAGQAIETDGAWRVLRIPPDGVLRVKDQAPFHRSNFVSFDIVQYANGKAAPVARTVYVRLIKDPNEPSSTVSPGTTRMWVIEPKRVR